MFNLEWDFVFFYLILCFSNSTHNAVYLVLVHYKIVNLLPFDGARHVDSFC